MTIPGEYFLSDEPVEINAGRRTVRLTVSNTGDRAIQVGSHFHFYEVNRALEFDRPASFGMRLDIPAGTAVRFEPGDTREVPLVDVGGARRVVGFNGLVMGHADQLGQLQQSQSLAADRGFRGATTKGGVD